MLPPSSVHSVPRSLPMRAAWAAGLCAALLLLAGCGKGNDERSAAGSADPTGSQLPSDFDPKVLRRGNGPEPDTLDPQVARTEGAFHILRDAFEGLTAVGSDGAPVPAAAVFVDRGAATAWSIASRCARVCAGRMATGSPLPISCAACAGWSIQRPRRRTRRCSIRW